MSERKDFTVGKTVKVIAKYTKGIDKYDVLTDCDKELGVETGDIGVVTTHPVDTENTMLFVYVNLSEELPHYAFFPEQLQIMETN